MQQPRLPLPLLLGRTAAQPTALAGGPKLGGGEALQGFEVPDGDVSARDF